MVSIIRMIGKVYKIYLGNSTQRWVIQGNSYFTHGDLLCFDNNTETIDAYVAHIRQLAGLLGYEEPQIL